MLDSIQAKHNNIQAMRSKKPTRIGQGLRIESRHMKRADSGDVQQQ